MKHISTCIYTFSELINHDYLYVDKTEYLYRLVREPKGQYFGARPRRFGKSLAISTLDAIFRGQRELFRGLYIYDADYDWKTYPVIHIDFARMDMTDRESLTVSLNDCLRRIAVSYGLDADALAADGIRTPTLFGRLIDALSDRYQEQVVLLIDEYDKPILDHMNSPEEAEACRAYMDNFYQIIKGSEPAIRFAFITGVTRFAKVSIFSKLNNFDDITMDERYSGMFGYTQRELEENFAPFLEEAATAGNLTRAELTERIREWYDGFLFAEHGETMYNPVSVGQFFNSGYRFENFWFATGTARFLVDLVKKNHLVLADLTDVTMSANSFNTFDATMLASGEVQREALIQMLYQTGYLTLDSVLVEKPKIYRLRFPNYEVRQSFSENLLNVYAGSSRTESFVAGVLSAAQDGDTGQMMEYMSGFFAGLPYDLQIRNEKYYQSIVYTIFTLCGMDMLTEFKTNTGRIDAVLMAGRHIYIIELKLNQSADAALEQINDKKYEERFLLPARLAGKKIHKLGINFCYADGVRNITQWREE